MVNNNFDAKLLVEFVLHMFECKMDFYNIW